MVAESFRLIIQVGPNVGKVFDLDQDVLTIGRDMGNPVVVNDPEVSRKHAQLSRQAGGYIIEDLGSTNGTFVNGQRLAGPHLLRHGEKIMLGEKVTLAFEATTYDPDATLMGTSGVPAAPPPPLETFRVPAPSYDVYAQQPQPEPPPPPVYQPSYEPAYSGQVPPGPAEPYMPMEGAYETPLEEAPQKDNRTKIYIACGCLVLLALCCLVGAFVYDYLDLYCQTPGINQLLNCP